MGHYEVAHRGCGAHGFRVEVVQHSDATEGRGVVAAEVGQRGFGIASEVVHLHSGVAAYDDLVAYGVVAYWRELQAGQLPVAGDTHRLDRGQGYPIECVGGVGFEVGALLLNRGYKVCGVRYNADNNRAEHYIASDVRELIQSAGSKYIQSYTVDAFKAINRKEKYLVTGTPCQIDSFRRYIQKFRCEDNFVLLDFFCHGVPSMFVWQKYIK